MTEQCQLHQPKVRHRTDHFHSVSQSDAKRLDFAMKYICKSGVSNITLNFRMTQRMYRILIAEDNRHVVSALKRLLSVARDIHVVGCVFSEAAAVEWLVLQNEEWDFAIVDLALGLGNSMHVLSACRVRQAGQKVAVLATKFNPSMRRKCEIFGADAAFERDTQIELVASYCISAAQKSRSARVSQRGLQ